VTASGQVLLVDDEANIRRMLGALLRDEGLAVVEAPNGNAALLMVDQADPDVILLDLLMSPGPDGLETLARLRERGRLTPVIMMSGKAQLTDAVRAVKLGAFQFLEKPLTPEAVLATVRAALELDRTRAQNRALQAELARRASLIGDSPSMQQVRGLIERVGPTEARVLVTGESGTGKELVAAAIHAASRRANRAFVTVNCAAIPRDLVESEMFGHERGAFTDARQRRRGKFEEADGGTLFLDEIGEMSLSAQVRLLRVLQDDGEFTRVGGNEVLKVDVRVIAASNVDLEQATGQGTFRRDLFYRLSVFPVKLPPLRERAGDIHPLVIHFLEHYKQKTGRFISGISKDALRALVSYDWPGNVRELESVIERAVLFCQQDQITPETLPEEIYSTQANNFRCEIPPYLTLEEIEREAIEQTLMRTGSNVKKTAQILNLHRPTLYRKLRKFGIKHKDSDAVAE
jgi:two-component system, NtrC family, nitrogen regulation response regulator NtrX